MQKNLRILVVGGGNVERAPGGGWVTKAPIASYLHELADEFGQCVWLVQISGTWQVQSTHENVNLAGKIDSSRVRVVPLNYSRIRNAPYCWLILLREAMCRPYAILFLPAILTLTPVVPMVSLLCKRTAVYLAGDYQTPARELASRKWFGWSFLYRSAFQIALCMADFVIARGRFLVAQAREHNARVIETIPLAHMNFDHLVPPRDLQPSSKRQILFLGLLLWSKGLGELLHALKTLVEKIPAALTLEILGDGPDREGIEALCQSLGLEQQVHFRGWIERGEDLELYFQSTDLLVMPTSTYPEGVPRVIDEALIRGIPVVATRLPGVVGEFRDDEVRIVDCGDAGALARGMEDLLFDPALRKRYVEGALRRRKYWTERGTAAQQHARLLRQGITFSC